MKRVLLISDNHGMIMNLLKLAEIIGPVDYVLHMGDIEGNEEKIRKLFAPAPVEFVCGNCDGRSCKESPSRVLDLEGHRIFMTHGHQQGVNWDLSGMESVARQFGADLALYGHTHVPNIEYLDDMMIINPGSISRPRQSGRKPSYGILELKEGVFPCYCSIGYLE